MEFFKLFYRKDCPKCPAAKDVAAKIEAAGWRVQHHDVDTTDGLTESAFHSVMAVPSLLLVDEFDKELAEWRGNVPHIEQILNKVAAL